MTFICVSVCPSHGVCGLWRSEDTCRSWACSSTVRAPGIKLRTLHARRQASLSTEPSLTALKLTCDFCVFSRARAKAPGPYPYPDTSVSWAACSVRKNKHQRHPLESWPTTTGRRKLCFISRTSVMMQTPRKSCKANKSGLREGAEPGPWGLFATVAQHGMTHRHWTEWVRTGKQRPLTVHLQQSLPHRASGLCGGRSPCGPIPRRPGGHKWLPRRTVTVLWYWSPTMRRAC